VRKAKMSSVRIRTNEFETKGTNCSWFTCVNLQGLAFKVAYSGDPWVIRRLMIGLLIFNTICGFGPDLYL
jgi:hypothetical protein